MTTAVCLYPHRRPRCRHCRERVAARPRGLCWRCFYLPGVRDLYPPGSTNPAMASALWGANMRKAWACGPDRHGGYRLPEPTTAAPGTPEKLAVLEQRARERRALWHPDDARYEGDPVPHAATRAAG